MIKPHLTLVVLLIAAAITQSCNNPNSTKVAAGTENKYEGLLLGEPAPEWTAILKNDSGWLASDGIYCVSMDGSEAPGTGDSVETFMWFSDTILGVIEGDTVKKGYDMVHNTALYFTGMPPDPARVSFNFKSDKDGKHQSYFEPQTLSAKPDEYYWLGDGVFNHAKDSTIYIMAYRVAPFKHDVWPFQLVGISLIALPKGSRPPFDKQRQIETPLYQKDKKYGGDLLFGSCLLPNTKGAKAPNPDGYIYIYGKRGIQNGLIVARVKDTDFEDLTQWRFWDGTTWSTDEQNSAILIEHAASEMSLSFMDDGRLLVVYSLDTTQPDIVMQVAKSFTGPFYPYKKVYHTPEIYEDIDFYTYSAKGFPHLSKPGELLVTYNVNAFNFEKTFERHPRIIHPRFIKLKYR